jgi:hypothetical protein
MQKLPDGLLLGFSANSVVDTGTGIWPVCRSCATASVLSHRGRQFAIELGLDAYSPLYIGAGLRGQAYSADQDLGDFLFF